MVCDLPVPGGPWMMKLRPVRAIETAASCVASAGTTLHRSDGASGGGGDASIGRGSIENTVSNDGGVTRSSINWV